jgi:hypothetical protein
MWISKKKILSLLNENLKNVEEMAMDFDTDDRPHRDIERDLERGETPFKNVPFPETDDNQKLEELLASARYRDVLQKFRRYVPNYNGTLRSDGSNIATLGAMMMQAIQNVMDFESRHKEQLEELSVNVIKQHVLRNFSDSVELRPKLVGFGDVNNEDFNFDSTRDSDRKSQQQNRQQPQQPQPQQQPQDGEDNEEEVNFDDVDINVEERLLNQLSDLDLEKAKRRMINSLIQGASKKGHYLFEILRNELGEIVGDRYVDAIMTQYGMIMSINDLTYWQMGNHQVDGIADASRPQGGRQQPQRPEQPPQQTMNLGGDDEEEEVERDSERQGAGSQMAGRVDVFRNHEKPIITAAGIIFPVLLHELIKGVYEVMSIQGMPKDENVAQQVSDTEDTLKKEAWDLRLGAEIWKRTLHSFPDEVFEDESLEDFQLLLYFSIIKLEPKKFLSVMYHIIQGTDKSKEIMVEFKNKIIEIQRQQSEYDERMAQGDEFNEEDYTSPEIDNIASEMANEISDEDLMSFFTAINFDVDNFDINDPGDNRLNN